MFGAKTAIHFPKLSANIRCGFSRIVFLLFDLIRGNENSSWACLRKIAFIQFQNMLCVFSVYDMIRVEFQNWWHMYLMDKVMREE